MTESPDTPTDRQRAMAICADATAAELGEALTALTPLPPSQDLRRPETGLVMLRGRMGGDGRAFNAGEATVTRAAVRLGDVVTGFAYHLGRDRAKARRAALIDALWQVPARRAAVDAALAPIVARAAADKERAARRTAATRVNFFTLVRGDD